MGHRWPHRARVSSLQATRPRRSSPGVTTRLPTWDQQRLRDFLDARRRDAAGDEGRDRAFELLALLMDRRYPTGGLRRGLVLALLDQRLDAIVADLRHAPSARYMYVGGGMPSSTVDAPAYAVVDARHLPSEGARSLSRAIVELCRRFKSRHPNIKRAGQSAARLVHDSYIDRLSLACHQDQPSAGRIGRPSAGSADAACRGWRSGLNAVFGIATRAPWTSCYPRPSKYSCRGDVRVCQIGRGAAASRRQGAALDSYR